MKENLTMFVEAILGGGGVFSYFVKVYLIEESQKLMKLVQKNHLAASSMVDAPVRPMSDSSRESNGI